MFIFCMEFVVVFQIQIQFYSCLVFIPFIIITSTLNVTPFYFYFYANLPLVLLIFEGNFKFCLKIFGNKKEVMNP
jgi:hypothetical protein